MTPILGLLFFSLPKLPSKLGFCFSIYLRAFYLMLFFFFILHSFLFLLQPIVVVLIFFRLDFCAF